MSGGEHRGQTERVLELLVTLTKHRKITKQRVFEILDVASQSSFKRYKAALAEAGFKLTYDKDDKHYHIPPSATISRFDTDPRDRAKLAQIRADIGALGRPAAEQFDGILSVLDARFALDDPESDAVITARHPQPAGGPEFYAALDRALTAVRERRYLSFAYARTAQAADAGRDERTVRPYAVHAHDGRYYLWAIVEGEMRPKLFALDLARDVRIEDDGFDPDPGLSLADDLRASFGVMLGEGPPRRVVVRISAKAAPFVACRRWPAQVALDTRADGSLEIVFLLTSFLELVAWALSFGGEATIVEPPAARKAFHDAAMRAAAASVS